MRYLGHKTNNQYIPTYPVYFATVKLALSRSLVTDIPSLLLFALRQYGPLFNQSHYMVFAFLLLMIHNNKEIS